MRRFQLQCGRAEALEDRIHTHCLYSCRNRAIIVNAIGGSERRPRSEVH